MLNVALPKGRLGQKVYDFFEASGYRCPDIQAESRRLRFETENGEIRFFWVKPSDVPIYVERGAADIGVAGKDTLVENEPEIYELLDLNIGKCRMCVAAPKGFHDSGRKTLRVGTSFPNIARRYYSGIGREIDIITLHGSVELAPLMGLSDVIVDIVETGTTLRENGLEPITDILPVSARLIANRASWQFHSDEIRKIVEAMKEQVKEK